MRSRLPAGPVYLGIPTDLLSQAVSDSHRPGAAARPFAKPPRPTVLRACELLRAAPAGR